jgi:GH25 family lysozyme M1 (1,4-beta-N-acetylmuramidase)
MAVSDVAEALARCMVTTHWAVGMCGQFCAAMYGYGASGYNDAVVQWQQTPGTLRRPGATDAPPGCLLFWGGGSAGHGHVAIADGVGGCWSIDIGGPGTVTHVSAGTISARWGLPYLGWAAPYFQGEQWSPAMIYGVDVSNYQPINFALTTPGDSKPVDFAIIKVTEGVSVTNSRFTGQRQWARDHGLAVGYYHFGRPGDMIANADFFLSNLGAPAPGESLWFDWEDAGISSAQKDQWIKYVQGKIPGLRVGLYCNTDFWKNRDTSSFAGDGLWIATGGIPAGSPPIQSSWVMHQYSTAGNYDHDLAAFATKADMINWAGGDVALSADDKAWLTAQLTATSLVDGKAHGVGYYLAHGQQDQAAILKQAQTNGSSLTTVKTALADANTKLDTVTAVLATVDLSQLPAEIAAKLESLKLVVSVQEGA